MGSFNKVVITTAILMVAAYLLWPLLVEEQQVREHSQVFLNEDILGDGSAAILPIPSSLNLDPNKISLGKKLFFDARLSNNEFSCSSCHDLESSGTDNRKLSLTTSGADDQVNTPTIFNSGFNPLLLWNGMHESLEGQIHAVIHDPKHMNSNWDTIIDQLSQDQHYPGLFKQTYKSGLTAESITNALSTFVRSLITPDAAFDRYLKGNRDALTPSQLEGFRLFQEYGCISCHQGINIGGNLLAKFGVFKDEIHTKAKLTEYDQGRYNYTHVKKDLFVFRVPSLRNVAATAPYFHDGRSDTLEDAVKTMALIQLDMELSSDEIDLIVDFLHSLSGKFEGRQL